MARLARLLTGRATGVVLSGGGARGFAHIGALRALHEAGVPIDAVGGTSIGAIIAALWATGMGYDEVVRRVRRTFVDVNPLNDYTMPVLSLVAGRKVGVLLRRELGDVDIEDLRLPFFCLSANLTTGQAAVHRREAVALASRLGGHSGRASARMHRQPGLCRWRDDQQPACRCDARDHNRTCHRHRCRC